MKKTKAFTLIEITISLTVFFVIITIILTTTRNIFLNQKEMGLNISAKQQALTLLNKIDTELKGIYLSRDFPLSGIKDKITFYSLYKEENEGLRQITYQSKQQNIEYVNQSYLKTEKQTAKIISDMQIYFSYLTDDELLTESVIRGDKIKAINIKLTSGSKEFIHTIVINQN